MTQIHKIHFLETSYLPSICQRARCLRDAVAESRYCAGHQPKPKLPPSPWMGKSVVYVVGMEGEPFVKIGYASELSARMIGMQVGSPKQLIVHCVFAGDVKLESRLHLEMEKHHVRGEWFNLEPVKELCQKLGAERYARLRLKLDAVICEWSDEGYPWDAHGLPRKRRGFSRF